MNQLFLLSVSIWSLTLLTGCSLFSFKIKTLNQSRLVELSQPRHIFDQRLPSQANFSLSSLSKIQDFGQFFAVEIEKNASILALLIASQEQNNASQWKAIANRSMSNITAQTDFHAAVFDAWMYTKQMEYYFAFGAGKGFFGRNQYIPIGTSRSLHLRIRTIAKEILPAEIYDQMHAYIEKTHFFQTTSLHYQPRYHYWHEQNTSTPKTQNQLQQEAGYTASLLNALTFEPTDQRADKQNKAEPVDAKESHFEEPLTDSKHNLTSQLLATLERRVSNSANANPTEPELNQIAMANSLSKEALEKLVSTTTNLQGNLIANQKLHKFTFDLLSSQLASKQAIPNQDFVDLTKSPILSLSDKRPTIQQARPLDQNTDDRNNALLQTAAPFATEEKNAFLTWLLSMPHAQLLTVIGLFIIPFLLGYLIGKKRQDPNYTVISSADRRKELKHKT